MTSQTRYVVDTHALYWYTINSPKLSAPASKLFDDAVAGSATLIISYVVVAELIFLLQKVRQQHLLGQILTLLQTNPAYQLEPLLLEDVVRLPDFAEIPEMHDRLLAIQADRLAAPLITIDATIRASAKVRCVW